MPCWSPSALTLKGGGGSPGRGSFAWGSVLRCAMSTFAELLQQVQAKQPDPLRMGIFLEFGSIEWWICPFFGFSRYESDISRLLARCNTFEDHGDLLPSLTIDITEHPKPKRPSLTSHASQESQASQLVFFRGLTKNTTGKDFLARKKTLASPQLQLVRGWQLWEPTDLDRKKQEDDSEQECGPMGLGDAGPRDSPVSKAEARVSIKFVRACHRYDLVKREKKWNLSNSEKPHGISTYPQAPLQPGPFTSSPFNQHVVSL